MPPPCGAFQKIAAIHAGHQVFTKRLQGQDLSVAFARHAFVKVGSDNACSEMIQETVHVSKGTVSHDCFADLALAVGSVLGPPDTPTCASPKLPSLV